MCVCVWREGVGKITLPCLKLVRIMLETSHFARKYTHTYVILENISFSTKTLLILLMPALFCKTVFFWPK